MSEYYFLALCWKENLCLADLNLKNYYKNNILIYMKRANCSCAFFMCAEIRMDFSSLCADCRTGLTAKIFCS